MGRGYGKTAVQKLLSIIALEPGAHLVIVQPKKENTASCNTLLSADFLFVISLIQDELLQIYFMVILYGSHFILANDNVIHIKPI